MTGASRPTPLPAPNRAYTRESGSLNAFLAEPRILAPRTRMIPTAAIEDPQDRRDLIAYLKTQ